MSEFQNMMMGEFPADPEYDLWVRGWMAYFQAADRIDGHIKIPRSKHDYQLMNKAKIAGKYAMNEVFDQEHYKLSEIDSKISIKARLEALRRLRKCQ